ncbi:MAG: hypothetical protein KDD42_10090, partial [Bdellovibrionales bacterium]|nr:hypothetical protein [Bdellovibrionales bacterium]
PEVLGSDLKDLVGRSGAFPDRNVDNLSNKLLMSTLSGGSLSYEVINDILFQLTIGFVRYEGLVNAFDQATIDRRMRILSRFGAELTECSTFSDGAKSQFFCRILPALYYPKRARGQDLDEDYESTDSETFLNIGKIVLSDWFQSSPRNRRQIEFDLAVALAKFGSYVLHSENFALNTRLMAGNTICASKRESFLGMEFETKDRAFDWDVFPDYQSALTKLCDLRSDALQILEGKQLSDFSRAVLGESVKTTIRLLQRVRRYSTDSEVRDSVAEKLS